jgi:hypothetical protein
VQLAKACSFCADALLLFLLLPLSLQLNCAAALRLLLDLHTTSKATTSGLLLGLLLLLVMLLWQDMLQLMCCCAAGICQHAHNALTYRWH